MESLVIYNLIVGVLLGCAFGLIIGFAAGRDYILWKHEDILKPIPGVWVDEVGAETKGEKE